MSNIDKHALRERYSAKSTPKCDICGAQMTIQRISGSRVTYGCSGAIYDETGCHYADGRSLADEHYEQSRVTVTDESDPDVLALLDELEAKDRRITEQVAIIAKQEKWTNDVEATMIAATDRAEAAEKRIAELETREVTLPRPACTYADHSYPAYSERQVVALLESLGIRINREGE